MSQLNDFPQTSPEGLLIEVEQAWEQGRGYECVSRLAEKHSNYADDLLDFLEGLLSIELGSTPDPEASKRSAAGIVARLEADGQHSLADAIRRSAGLPIPAAAISYPAYAAGQLGLVPPEVASGHGVPMRFLQQIDQHPRQTPLGALEEIARRGAALGLNYEEGLKALLAGPNSQTYAARAASSDGPLQKPQPFSYCDLVKRSFRNDPEACQYWLSFDDKLSP